MRIGGPDGRVLEVFEPRAWRLDRWLALLVAVFILREEFDVYECMLPVKGRLTYQRLRVRRLKARPPQAGADAVVRKMREKYLNR